MKKVLISVIILILLLISYKLIFSNISIGAYSTNSYQDIKNQSTTLDSKILQANETINQTYAENIEKLTTAIRNLRTIKETYETKTAGLDRDLNLGSSLIKKYKIEFLWTTVGEYAKQNELNLTMNVNSDTNELDFTLIGSYIGITDFIYDIENDETLNFKTLNFKLEPYTATTTSSTGNETTTTTTDRLKATFKVEDILVIN